MVLSILQLPVVLVTERERRTVRYLKKICSEIQKNYKASKICEFYSAIVNTFRAASVKLQCDLRGAATYYRSNFYQKYIFNKLIVVCDSQVVSGAQQIIFEHNRSNICYCYFFVQNPHFYTHN
ncbi:Hypothetical_protein [Hexamita inflata]|uniref:Hypothetical_protein n=1 Tax=Hexamita inflata TaxID=28002 RepID=A0AA86PUU5_9EUKA|nr:Hypothetical protein HINF_LOCUS31613 [Hexamita inflata]